jgi:hypothetical protein
MEYYNEEIKKIMDSKHSSGVGGVMDIPKCQPILDSIINQFEIQLDNNWNVISNIQDKISKLTGENFEPIKEIYEKCPGETSKSTILALNDIVRVLDQQYKSLILIKDVLCQVL